MAGPGPGNDGIGDIITGLGLDADPGRVMDGIRRRPVEKMRTAPPAPVRRAAAMSSREIVFLAAGVGATVASWSLMFVWC
jgi:hypothetical protein